MTSAGAAPAGAPPAAPPGPSFLRRLRSSTLVRPSAVVGGAALLLVAGVLPVWGSRLIAPQYPRGLDMWVYGGRAEGDIAEINGLNHYIGMQVIDLAAVPELALWPLLIVGLGVLLAGAVFLRGWPGRLALLGLWLAPVGVLVDIQRWLVIYGSDLDRTAALRLDPFVPLVVGPTDVWNFTIWTYPGPALGLLVVVALAATLARRTAAPARRVQGGVTALTLAVLAAGVLLVVVPAVSEARDDDAAHGDRPPAGTVDPQALIGGAEDGSTVQIPAGTYTTRLVIDRPLTVVADGEVLIDGGGRGTVVTITAPDVTFRGFRVENSGGQVEEAAGIKVLADGARIEANRIARTFTAIAVLGATDVTVVDNEIRGAGRVTTGASHATDHSPDGAGDGQEDDPDDPHAGHGRGSGPGGQGDAISLWNVQRALLRGNHVEHVRDGIYLSFVDDVLVDTNVVTDSRYGVHSMFGVRHTLFGNTLSGNLAGLALMYNSDVIAGRNRIADHRAIGTGFGIILKDVSGVRIAENVVSGNRIGLQAEGTREGQDRDGLVLMNRFAANDVGVALLASADLTFGRNTFEGNLTQVLALEAGVESRNRWSHEYLGNLWSDYVGYDLNGDGIGDIPHRSGGVDRVLLGRSPALVAFRAAPVMHLLDVAQSMWDAAQRPIVRDESPLIADSAPVAEPGVRSDTPSVWYLLATGLLGLALVPVLVLRR